MSHDVEVVVKIAHSNSFGAQLDKAVDASYTLPHAQFLLLEGLGLVERKNKVVPAK